MTMLDLTAEELLTTTRAVRKRLDFDRPVERDVLRRCVELALQAPSGSNRNPVRFVIVTEPARRAALGDAYREAFAAYEASEGFIGKIEKDSAEANAQQQRTAGSATHLAQNIDRAPAIVVACGVGGLEGKSPQRIVNSAGSIHPATWSFMLAARLHGLGTCWTAMSIGPGTTTAELLGIPADVTMGALTPVAYTQGTDFRPALRPDPDSVIHWETW